MQFVAGTQTITLSPETSFTADVGFGPGAGGAKGFNVRVAMPITVPGMHRDAAQALLDAAHEVGPSSNATCRNVDVTLAVV